MQIYKEELSIKGNLVKFDAIRIDNKILIQTGRFCKIVRIKEEWLEDVEDPELIIRELKKSGFKADIFTFCQRLPDTTPKYNYYTEWENLAALSITIYDNWFKKQIHQNTRNKIRKAKKKGVQVKCVDFDDEFVKGIVNIYNENPVRQGKPFWYYGKDFETIKISHSTFNDRSFYIGAYFNDEMIGFIKLISTGKYIRTMYVISLIKHRDKAPINLLLAKAVKICEDKKSPYLVYGSFDYGKRGSPSLTNFKRYNGFKKILLPRYYIPLTTKGKIILKTNMHHGFINILPEKLIIRLLSLRNKWYNKKIA